MQDLSAGFGNGGKKRWWIDEFWVSSWKVNLKFGIAKVIPGLEKMWCDGIVATWTKELVGGYWRNYWPLLWVLFGLGMTGRLVKWSFGWVCLTYRSAWVGDRKHVGSSLCSMIYYLGRLLNDCWRVDAVLWWVVCDGCWMEKSWLRRCRSLNILGESEIELASLRWEDSWLREWIDKAKKTFCCKCEGGVYFCEFPRVSNRIYQVRIQPQMINCRRKEPYWVSNFAQSQHSTVWVTCRIHFRCHWCISLAL